MRRLPATVVAALVRPAGVLLALLALGSAASGQSLTGHWVGSLPQNDKAFVFKLEVELKQAGNQLSGTSQLTSNTGQWVVEQFSGTLAGRQVVLRESGIVRCSPGTEALWCVKTLRGKLTVASTRLTISGDWQATPPCAPGQFTISKAVAPARAVARRSRRRDPPPAEAAPAAVVLNQPAAFQNVLFEQGRAVLLPASAAELDELVAVLAARPALRVTIAGHADRLGEAQKNLVLSQQRAQAVRDYLLAHGIAAARVATVGYGDTRLVCPPPCTANQRVEFTLAE